MKYLFGIILLCILISPVSCAFHPHKDLSPCCAVFKRIHPSPEDTNATLRQIYEHNRVYDMLCGEKE